MGGRGDQHDFDVRAAVTSHGVSVAYRQPGSSDLDAWVKLPPLPLSLF
jgi:hypothetical protein